MKSPSSLFEQRVVNSPESIVLVDGECHVSYRTLNIKANQLARHLIGLGICHGDRILVCVDRCIEGIVALLAVSKMGGVYVPLEPTAADVRVRSIMRKAKATALIAQADRDAFDEFTNQKVILREHGVAANRQSGDNLETIASREDLFAILFTSGSIAEPKGVLIRRSSTVNLIIAMSLQFPCYSEDVSLLHRSFSFVGSLWECFGALATGIRSTILAADEARDPAAIWKCLIENEVTHMAASPTLLEIILKYGERHRLVSRSLRVAFVGGEAVVAQVVLRSRAVFPRADIYVGYGTTETMYISFLNTRLLLDSSDEVLPVGKPIRDVSVYVLDQELEPVLAGAVGEICVVSPYVSHGYLDQPEMTTDRFVKAPWVSQPGSLMYRTGDLGYRRTDGMLALRGRLDRVVKIKGWSVGLEEVEAAIRRISGSTRVAVITRSDARGQQAMTAYIEMQSEVSADHLRRSLRELLPDHMVPTAFIVLKAIPVTSTGKVDLRALPEVPNEPH